MFNKLLGSARKGFEAVKGAALAAVVAVGAAVASLPMPAHAALVLDDAGILADIAVCVAFITSVGLAVLGMIYLAKSIRWARRAG